MPLVLNQQKNQRGATLIEVLVAVFLLTVGLLAMAALSVNATTYSKMAQIRGTATMLVNDYSERAKANLVGFDRAQYQKVSKFNSTLPSAPSACSVNDTGPDAADCIAAFDQAEWLREIASRLPQGSAYVETSQPAKGDRGVRTMNIWISWKEQDSSIALMNTSPVACPTQGTPSSGTRCLFFRVAI